MSNTKKEIDLDTAVKFLQEAAQLRLSSESSSEDEAYAYAAKVLDSLILEARKLSGPQRELPGQQQAAVKFLLKVARIPLDSELGDDEDPADPMDTLDPLIIEAQELSRQERAAAG